MQSDKKKKLIVFRRAYKQPQSIVNKLFSANSFSRFTGKCKQTHKDWKTHISSFRFLWKVRVLFNVIKLLGIATEVEKRGKNSIRKHLLAAFHPRHDEYKAYNGKDLFHLAFF